ncbi:hypothetical protein [Tautonia sociabilis]|uniref:Uncharacterized protein n=1 Tax=Tautonia sociabilis TaxID=2080755 RepID=A0A432MFQ8_9BACT|nr:hypothetical protein [Tautonia sociabilis]RUL85057.1 hypothetical protein TsocGM_19140 [Tautonia sociabilis]
MMMVEPPVPLEADPEFRAVASARGLPSVVDPGAYRRVLVNPFLGLLGAGAWVAAARAVLVVGVEGMARPLLLVWLLVGAILLPRLFQFHCLDCGRTGRLARWRRHVCPKIARRIVEGRPLRIRWPGPIAQLVVWGYVLAVVLVLVRIGVPTSR